MTRGLNLIALMCVLSDQELIEDNYTSMDTVSWCWFDKLFEKEEENVQLKSKLHHLQLVGQAVVATSNTHVGSFRFMLCPSLMFSYWVGAAAGTVTR